MTHLTIFEGPDGGGKTTAAKKYAQGTGAIYTHMGPFPERTDDDLTQEYVNAMMPALLGRSHVVMDRSWISEPIYGEVHRSGANRITPRARGLLEMLARGLCDSLVVLCIPSYSTIRESFARRKQIELLADEAALMRVYDLYTRMETTLAISKYNRDLSYDVFAAARSNRENASC